MCTEHMLPTANIQMNKEKCNVHTCQYFIMHEQHHVTISQGQISLWTVEQISRQYSKTKKLKKMSVICDTCSAVNVLPAYFVYYLYHRSSVARTSGTTCFAHVCIIIIN